MKLKTNLLLLSIFLGTATFAQSEKFGTYYNQRRTLFEQLPDTKKEIVFLGNSITDGGEWVELFNNKRCKNRGISGDVTEGVLFRLDEVIHSKPAKVFLLIGINDLSRGISKDTVFANICKIAENIRSASPKTKVYIQSIFPVNASFGKFEKHVNKGGDVIFINTELRKWCVENGFFYVDLYSQLVTPGTDLLNPEFTNDGLHLLGAGYMKWAEVVKPLLK
ncbi:SGNH/GDSL hydrolase family protein [Draconibacterium sp.]|jgi:lysophospholipase L1-like esterase